MSAVNKQYEMQYSYCATGVYMYNLKRAVLGGLLGVACLGVSQASTVSDDFTQPAVNDYSLPTGNKPNWLAIAPACLTAGTAATNSGTSVDTSNATYSNIPACSANSSVSGIAVGSEDSPGAGALRLTNAAGQQAGAIISQTPYSSSQGLQITFTTYTYGGTGADGIGFFLQDYNYPATFPSTVNVGANVTTGNVNIGESGGSLGYSCSNYKPQNYNGLTGGYLGLGMDEYGNFLATGDNTATGISSSTTPNTIGLRGAGNVSWYWLNTNYPTWYPSNLSSAHQQLAVNNTCSTGTLWDNSANDGRPVNQNVTSSKSNSGSGAVLMDYALIGNGSAKGYATLSTSKLPIWSKATTRASATPITYRLSITPAGLLSFMYNYNGAANFTSVLSNFDIKTNNGGTIPTNFRFGFLGSTGGSTNIHEITCFVAEPVQSSSSVGANTIQAGQVRTGTQTYLASFNPNNWTGSLQSVGLFADTTTGVISSGTTADWDASCVLTGGTCAATGINTGTAQAPSSRTLLTWNSTTSKGTPFEWSSPGITSTQQSVLSTSLSGYSSGTNRLSWLRGDRTQEQSATPAGSLRTRAGVFGDVVNSSPVWVGPPSLTIPATITDRLYGSAGSESSYPTYAATMATRQNVVYVGSNDGFLHGFRAGSNNTDGTYNSATNDGKELLGFMPGGVLSNTNTTNNTLVLTDPTYGHSFYVDATPGTGDLYYNGAWHTWLVGGLGQGGAEIYALDITDPTGAVTTGEAFSETNASSVVMGDWTASTLTTLGCVNVASTKHCGDNLGNTYGTPLIRRMHNGNFALIFGNGYASTNQHAGIFIGVISATNGSVSFYWLDTGVGSASKPNGIAYVNSADLDGDHVADYLYAGDLQGNVWRFDVTSSNPADWAASTYGQSSATPLFVAKDSLGNTQPITTLILPSVAYTGCGSGAITVLCGINRVILSFGTGQANPINLTGASTYAQTGTQTMYGIWDWDMGHWNGGSTSASGVVIPAVGSAYALASQAEASSVTSITRSNLLANTATTSTANARYIPTSTVCWNGTTCTTTVTTGTPNTTVVTDSTGTVTGTTTTTVGSVTTTIAPGTQYGWYFDLPGLTGSGSNKNYEQVVYNPRLNGGSVFVNSTTPPGGSSIQCASSQPTNWTMSFDVISGGGEVKSVFPDAGSSAVNGAYIAGIQSNAVGTPYFVSIGNQTYAVSQTVGGGGATISRVTPRGGVTLKRLSWEQIR